MEVERTEGRRCVTEDLIWHDAYEEQPEDDGYVLAIVSGASRSPHENIILDDAYELACYIEGEGWTLECWPEWKHPSVRWWMYPPEAPD